MRRSTLAFLCSLTLLCLGFAVPVARADAGSPTTATVSFGAWQTEPPLDRFPSRYPRAYARGTC
jgi:hypothetical protein